MKVLVISAMYPTTDDPTYGIYVQETVENLRKHQNVQSTVIASMTTGRGVIAFFKYIDVTLRCLYYIMRGKFDIIHAHYVLPAGLIALFPKYIRRKKLVITAHGSDINILPQRNVILWYLTRFVLRRADGVIAVSEHLYGRITNDFGIEKEKVSVISCGVDPALFKPMDKILCRDILSLDAQKFIVFHLSGLDPVKRVDLLVNGFKLARERLGSTLLVIGGTGKQKSKLMNMVNQLGIDDYVIFTGFINKNDVPAWMNASDVFVLTSESEGTPVTLLEALAVGTNVVVSKVGGIPEVVGNLGIVIEKPTPEKVAEALICYYKDPKRYNFRNRIKNAESYHWSRISEKIADVYADVTDAR